MLRAQPALQGTQIYHRKNVYPVSERSKFGSVTLPSMFVALMTGAYGLPFVLQYGRQSEL